MAQKDEQILELERAIERSNEILELLRSEKYSYEQAEKLSRLYVGIRPSWVSTEISLYYDRAHRCRDKMYTLLEDWENEKGGDI